MTRPLTYAPGTLEHLVIGAVVSVGVAVGCLVLRLVPLERKEILCTVCCLGPALAFPAVAGVVHRVTVAPEFDAAGVNPWGAGAYTLRHANDWPSQINFLFGHLIPDLLTGRRYSFNISDAENILVSWLGVATFGFALAAGGLVVGPLRALGRSSEGAIWLFAAPPVILTLLLLPSWRLNSDGSVRYYVVCAPGLYLLVSALARKLGGNRSVLGWAFVAAFALYSAVDLVAHSPPHPVSPSAESVAQLATDEGVQVIFTQGGLGKDLIWATRGRIVVVDGTHPKQDWWYLRPADAATAECIARVTLDESTFRSVLGDRAGLYRATREYPDGTVIYRKR